MERAVIPTPGTGRGPRLRRDGDRHGDTSVRALSSAVDEFVFGIKHVWTDLVVGSTALAVYSGQSDS